jgi:uncharacterized membrane protein YphA (DoxX/SURF4 family)
MNKIISKGQLIFGIAIGAYGAEDLICARLGLSVGGVPWFPLSAFWGYVTGVPLIAAGISIMFNLQARMTATFLGILFFCYVLISELPQVIAMPRSIGTRTVFFEALAMCASSWALAATLPKVGAVQRWDIILDKLVASGPCLFGVSSVVFGIDHFLILAFIASLVPAWMPGAMFWAYLTGAAFVAAGISIIIRRMDRWSGFMLGLMFLLWFLLLHSPRVVAAFRSHNPNAPDEWSSAFIALAMCGGSWICAWHAQQRRNQHSK